MAAQIEDAVANLSLSADDKNIYLVHPDVDRLIIENLDVKNKKVVRLCNKHLKSQVDDTIKSVYASQCATFIHQLASSSFKLKTIALELDPGRHDTALHYVDGFFESHKYFNELENLRIHYNNDEYNNYTRRGFTGLRLIGLDALKDDTTVFPRLTNFTLRFGDYLSPHSYHDQFIAQLAKMQFVKRLKSLTLSRVDTASMRGLMLACSSSLEELSLSNLDDYLVDFRHVLKEPLDMPCLRELYLRSIAFEESTAQSLVESNFPALTKLKFSQIETRRFPLLASAKWQPQIKALHVERMYLSFFESLISITWPQVEDLCADLKGEGYKTHLQSYTDDNADDGGDGSDDDCEFVDSEDEIENEMQGRRRPRGDVAHLITDDNFPKVSAVFQELKTLF